MAEEDDLARAVEQDALQRRAELLTVPGAREVIAAGFVPLEELTGAVELAGVWPEQHLRVLTDTRWGTWPELDPDEQDLEGADESEPGFGDGKVYLVRSPWPAIDLETVLKLAHRWRQRNRNAYASPMTAHGADAQAKVTTWIVDLQAQKDVDRRFFTQTEAWVIAFGHGRVNRMR